MSQVPRTWTEHFGHRVAKCIGQNSFNHFEKKYVVQKKKIFSLQTWINGTFIALQAVFCIAMDDQTLFFIWSFHRSFTKMITATQGQ